MPRSLPVYPVQDTSYLQSNEMTNLMFTNSKLAINELKCPSDQFTYQKL